jgi:hypothetical protein
MKLAVIDREENQLSEIDFMILEMLKHTSIRNLSSSISDRFTILHCDYLKRREGRRFSRLKDPVIDD